MVRFTTDKAEFNRRERQSQCDRSGIHYNSIRSTTRRLQPRARSVQAAPEEENEPIDFTLASTDPENETVEADMQTQSTKESDTDRETSFVAFLNSSKFSDFTVFLGPDQIKIYAHRLILSVTSPYFNDLFSGKFKEGQEREVRFKEYSTHALWRVFEYMYKKTYSDEITEVQGEDDPELFKHPRVFALADMFRMDDLKHLAAERFKNQLRELWMSDTFPDCIQEVYLNSAPNDFSMKCIVVEVSRVHLKQLTNRQNFQRALRQVGDFAVDLLLAVGDDGLGQSGLG